MLTNPKHAGKTRWQNTLARKATVKIKTWIGLVLFTLIWFGLAKQASAVGYTLTVAAQGPGSVTKNPTNATYPPGVVVTVTATPNAASYFTGWSGDTNGTVNPLNVTMNNNYVITGNFLAFPTYPLTLATNGQGNIALSPSNASYASNTLVTATATPAAGWVFTGWTGSAAGVTNPLSFTMNSSNSLTGNFAQLPAFDVQPVSVTNSPGSTVSLTAHAVGTAPLTYQWYFNSAAVAGATNGTLTYTNVQFSKAGSYKIIATNSYGSATSSVVLLVLTNGAANPVSVCDEPSLRAAIAAGGWIQFGCNGTITLSNTITVSNSVILDGTYVSATISGGNAVRIFTVLPGASFTVTNLTLANGAVKNSAYNDAAPADGGGIYNNGGIVNLIACQLTGNLATNSFYDYYSGFLGYARGGAIFNNGGVVGLVGTSFSNNVAFGGTEVTVGSGGAIFTTNGSVTMAGCTFNGNACNSYRPIPSAGGAICIASGSMTATNCLFNTNAAFGAITGTTIYGLVSITGEGGAIALMSGGLTVQQCRFLNNVAQGGSENGFGGPGFGGAVYVGGTANISRSYFFNNRAAPLYSYGNYQSSKFTQNYAGGAIYNLGSLTLNSCCICSNFVRGTDGIGSQGGIVPPGNGYGAGIYNASQITATNCTLALNSAQAGIGYVYPYLGSAANGKAIGGGIYNIGATTILMNVTIASNRCDATGNSTNGFSGGDQIANVSGTLWLHNSLLAYAGTNGNAYGPITDDGYNISSDGSAAFGGGNSYNFTDPKLLALADNGGPTLTMALQSISPAIDSGDSSGAPGTDQRGFLRPIGDGVDMGAYEHGSYGAPAPLNLAGIASAPNFILSFTASPPFTYHLQCSTNLTAWTELENLGTFSSVSNLTRTLSPQGNKKFFRVWYQ